MKQKATHIARYTQEKSWLSLTLTNESANPFTLFYYCSYLIRLRFRRSSHLLHLLLFPPLTVALVCFLCEHCSTCTRRLVDSHCFHYLRGSPSFSFSLKKKHFHCYCICSMMYYHFFFPLFPSTTFLTNSQLTQSVSTESVGRVKKK